jgi:FkbM family methyltransferase
MSLLRSIVKAVLPPPATIRLRSAFKKHEPERALLPALCDSRRLGLDIGAALGAYSWPMSKLCARCIAFEPNPEQARYLRRAFGPRLQVEGSALSDRSGEVELVIPLARHDDKAGLATIAPGPWLGGQPVRRIKVATHTLDQLALEPVGFVKLDVEGHELPVLKGGQGLLLRDTPNLLVELEERFGPGTIEQTRAFLGQLGYLGYFLQGHALRGIAGFDPAVHQSMANWGVAGSYINNFIFVAADQSQDVQGRLRALGYELEVK